MDQQFPAPENPDQYVAEGPDRRAGQMTLFRVGALTTMASRELCVVRNLSTDRMRLRAFSLLTAGQRVSIEFKHGETIDGTVVAADQSTAEVEFDKPIDVAATLSSVPDGPRPRMPRIDIDCSAMVRHGARLVRGRAIDISQGGIRLAGVESLPLRASVVVSIGGMPPEPAVVAWRNGTMTGLSFNRLLSIRQLVDWLHEQKKVSAAGPVSACAATA